MVEYDILLKHTRKVWYYPPQKKKISSQYNFDLWDKFIYKKRGFVIFRILRQFSNLVKYIRSFCIIPIQNH